MKYRVTVVISDSISCYVNQPTNNKRSSNGFKDKDDIRLKSRVLMKKHHISGNTTNLEGLS